MKNLKLFVSAIIAVTILSTTTFAQDGAAAGGDKNFRFSPIALLVGGILLDLDFKIHNDWTLGPSLSVYKIDIDAKDYDNDIEASGGSLGIRANWFNNGVYTDGLYVGPSLRHATMKAEVVDNNGDLITAEGKTMIFSTLVGYGWFWQSFNMMLGGGFAIPLGDKEVTVDDGVTKKEVKLTSGFALEYSLGWTF